MTIAENLARVQKRIAAAAAQAGRRSEDVHLIAVSKIHPAESIREAYAAGQRHFGENYVQELNEKQEALQELPDIVWHFIGHVQSRKAKDLALPETWIHGVDSASAADKLNARALERELVLPVFLQVNVGDENSKSGVAPDEAVAFAQNLRSRPGLAWRGLMAIPPHSDDAAQQRAYFRRMRELRDTLSKTYDVPLELSMGMSGDFEMAIAEGADWVRIGTAIFGERPPKPGIP
jgi:pyridoxal phosphate enzyme (YggS family)